MSTERRKCKKCGKVKNVSMFYTKDRSSPYPSQRWQSFCKACQNGIATRSQRIRRWEASRAHLTKWIERESSHEKSLVGSSGKSGGENSVELPASGTLKRVNE